MKRTITIFNMITSLKVTRKFVAVFTLVAAMHTLSVRGQTLMFYGASDDTDELVLFNANTGTTTVVGDFNASDIEAMKFNPDYTTLYAIDAGQLGTVDLLSGNFLPLPNPIGNNLQGSDGSLDADDVDAMAFNPTTGELYGCIRDYSWFSTHGHLIKIDPVTGQYIPDAFGSGTDYVPVQSNGNRVHIDGMAFIGNTLYAVQNNNGSGNHLVIIDLTNGNTTDLGQLQTGGTDLDDVEAMSSLPDGRLFVTVGGNGGSQSRRIYEVQNLDPSQCVEIGRYGNGDDFEGSVARMIPAAPDNDNDSVDDETDLDDDNDGIPDVEEGCAYDDLDFTVNGSNVTGTTSIGVNATLNFPAGTFEKLSDAVGNNRARRYFDNPNFSFMGNLTRLDDGLQIEFSNGELIGFPDSGSGSAFDISFSGTHDVYEVYLHYNSIDQFRIVFDDANNPGIAYEILSSVATSNLAVSPDMNAGDNNTEDEDQTVGDERANGYGGGSADGTIRFYSTNGQPIQVIHLGLLEQEDRPSGETDLWQLAIQVRTARDFDGDMVYDCLDLDSDNDGIYRQGKTAFAYRF